VAKMAEMYQIDSEESELHSILKRLSHWFEWQLLDELCHSHLLSICISQRSSLVSTFINVEYNQFAPGPHKTNWSEPTLKLYSRQVTATVYGHLLTDSIQDGLELLARKIEKESDGHLTLHIINVHNREGFGIEVQSSSPHFESGLSYGKEFIEF
jgi:hypothetical protein